MSFRSFLLFEIYLLLVDPFHLMKIYVLELYTVLEKFRIKGNLWVKGREDDGKRKDSNIYWATTMH